MEEDKQGQGAPSNDTMVPKYRFDEVNKKYQEAEAKLTEMQKQVDEAKAKDERIAALEKELQDTKSGYELEKMNAKRAAAIDAAIKDKVVDAEVVQKLLDMEKISFDESGAVKGLDEQLKGLQESKPYLWKPAKPVAKTGGKQGDPVPDSFAKKLAEKKKAELGVTAKMKNYF